MLYIRQINIIDLVNLLFSKYWKLKSFESTFFHSIINIDKFNSVNYITFCINSLVLIILHRRNAQNLFESL